jgi:hypothetical protein
MRRLTRLAAAVTVLSALTACGHDPASPDPQGTTPSGPRAGGPITINVPEDQPTISKGVAAAREGDLVLVHPGTYQETVTVETPGITLRGTDRNRVVVDGDLIRSDGVVVTAAGVSVQNLTVRDHLQNGVLVTGMVSESGVYSHAHSGETAGESQDDAEGQSEGHSNYERLDPEKFPPLQGFQVDHVTAINNGLYGIYAFDAQRGLITDSYASGSADSGIYVGQCQPCDTVVHRNVMERNAVGFEDANAGGGLYVVGNRMVGNRIGATLTSDHQEAFVPQRGVVFAGNLLADNDQAATPSQADGGWGVGLGIAGGTENEILRNRITGHPSVGVLLGSHDDLPPIGNKVSENVLAGNATDAVYAASERAPGTGNCLADNELASVLPTGLLTLLACPGSGSELAGAPVPVFAAPAGIAFSEVAEPPAQPDLPEAATLPAVGPLNGPPTIDVRRIKVPGADLLARLSAFR